MSTKVKAIAVVPAGTYYGGHAFKVIERHYDDVSNARLEKTKPEDFKTWPRWKRCMWKAVATGVVFRAYRQPRVSQYSKTLFGRDLLHRTGVWLCKPKAGSNPFIKKKKIVFHRHEPLAVPAPTPATTRTTRTILDRADWAFDVPPIIVEERR